jgi:CBS domain-containing protein
MQVGELMITDVVRISRDATVRNAAAAMLRNDVGSVIVMDDTVPMGIVTETDVLAAGFEFDAPYSSIDVTTVMSSDLITATRDMTVRRAAETMIEEGVKKLPVVEDFEIVGIITMSDIVREHAALISEAKSWRSAKRSWETEDD